jgi:predicted N-acetyltransferase YhbS
MIEGSKSCHADEFEVFMSKRLDLHPASITECTEASRNVHDVWGGGLPLEEHVRRRLADPKFSNANWYVGCLDGRVVTSCGCYQVQVRIDGTGQRACAVGSVHTLAEFRGRGYAPQLLAFAESQESSAGRTFSLLYSDIGFSYYERLGYRRCSASQGWVNPTESKVTPSAAVRLVRFSRGDELATLVELYDQGHAELPLSIARSAEYWRYLFRQDPQDEFYFAEASGQRVGYVRIAIRKSGVVLRDISLVEDTQELKRALYAALIAEAKTRNVERVGGWMPADEVSRALFDVSDRVQELTMIKPLVDRIQVDDRHCQATDHFQEIDHV